jgi:hypothetical protein
MNSTRTAWNLSDGDPVRVLPHNQGPPKGAIDSHYVFKTGRCIEAWKDEVLVEIGEERIWFRESNAHVRLIRI